MDLKYFGQVGSGSELNHCGFTTLGGGGGGIVDWINVASAGQRFLVNGAWFCGVVFYKKPL
jgi:hypothetical protein